MTESQKFAFILLLNANRVGGAGEMELLSFGKIKIVS